MPQKNHLKYHPHHLYKFPVQGYIAIVSVLLYNFRLNQTHIERISFLIPLEFNSFGVNVSQFNQHMGRHFKVFTCFKIVGSYLDYI